MDLQEIRKIVELMNEHGLTLFDLTKKDFHLKLKKGADLDDLRGLMAGMSAGAVARAWLRVDGRGIGCAPGGAAR